METLTETTKKISLFGKELSFYNDELFNAAKLAIEMGYKVHTFKPSGFYIKQIFIDNGITFGSVSEYYSGVSYHTCHKSVLGSGNGTGFGLTKEPMLAKKEMSNRVLLFAPDWATNTHLIKKETWEEHIKRPINSILEYAEIKL